MAHQADVALRVATTHHDGGGNGGGGSGTSSSPHKHTPTSTQGLLSRKPSAYSDAAFTDITLSPQPSQDVDVTTDGVEDVRAHANAAEALQQQQQQWRQHREDGDGDEEQQQQQHGYYEGDDGVRWTVDQAIDGAGFGRFQWMMLCFTGLAWMGDAMEMMLLSFLGPSVQCEWGVRGSASTRLDSTRLDSKRLH